MEYRHQVVILTNLGSALVCKKCAWAKRFECLICICRNVSLQWVGKFTVPNVLTACHTLSVHVDEPPKWRPDAAFSSRQVHQLVISTWLVVSVQYLSGAFVLLMMSSGIMCRAERRTISDHVYAPPFGRSFVVPRLCLSVLAAATSCLDHGHLPHDRGEAA